MNKLIVPVYLNQRTVFDLIAMLKGGLSTVTSVTQTESDNKSNQGEISSKLGTGGVLSSLLKVDLSGNLASTDTQDSGVVSSEERVHTPASLFYQLRNLLYENEMIYKMDDRIGAPGSFVEFEGQLNRNPIIESLDIFFEFGKFAIGIDNTTPAKRSRKSQTKDVGSNEVLKMLKGLLELLKAGDTVDLVGIGINGNFSAVITLETGYLNDPMMSDLVDGQFKVLGVIVKSIHDESDSINLLRKTAFSKLPPDVMGGFFETLKNLRDEHEFDISPLGIEVKGPTIQILPVAIFA